MKIANKHCRWLSYRPDGGKEVGDEAEGNEGGKLLRG